MQHAMVSTKMDHIRVVQAEASEQAKRVVRAVRVGCIRVVQAESVVHAVKGAISLGAPHHADVNIFSRQCHIKEQSVVH